MPFLYETSLDVHGGIEAALSSPAQIESWIRKHSGAIEELFDTHYPNSPKENWHQVGMLEAIEVCAPVCVANGLPDEDDWEVRSAIEAHYIHFMPEGRLIMIEPQGGLVWTRVRSEIKDLLSPSPDCCWIIEL